MKIGHQIILTWAGALKMKTERNAFEKYFKTVWKGINLIQTIGEDFAFKLFDGKYVEGIVEEHWRTWQASAQRQGYKLVSIEMHWHKADDLASAEWDKSKVLFCSANRDMTAMQVEEFRLRWCKNKAHQIMNDYKTMIGAAE